MASKSTPEYEARRAARLANPYRISVAGWTEVARSTLPRLDSDLTIDFQFPALHQMIRREKAVRRDGLGVLAVVGPVSYHQYSSRNDILMIPELLKELDVPDTPVVVIPIFDRQFAGLNDNFENVLDVVGLGLRPTEVMAAGAKLVREVAERQIIL